VPSLRRFRHRRRWRAFGLNHRWWSGCLGCSDFDTSALGRLRAQPPDDRSQPAGGNPIAMNPIASLLLALSGAVNPTYQPQGGHPRLTAPGGVRHSGIGLPHPTPAGQPLGPRSMAGVLRRLPTLEVPSQFRVPFDQTVSLQEPAVARESQGTRIRGQSALDLGQELVHEDGERRCHQVDPAGHVQRVVAPEAAARAVGRPSCSSGRRTRRHRRCCRRRSPRIGPPTCCRPATALSCGRRGSRPVPGS